MLSPSRRHFHAALSADSMSETDQADPKQRLGYLHLAKHFAVMVALMYAGMFVLDPLYESVVGAAGVSDPWTQLPVLSNFMMAVNMTIPMVLYMILKRHSSRAIGEMSAAMFLPAALTMGPHLMGIMTTGTMMTLSHAAMIPLMAVVMILRFREHTPRSYDNWHNAEIVPMSRQTVPWPRREAAKPGTFS
jgi:hypothetical protein